MLVLMLSIMPMTAYSVNSGHQILKLTPHYLLNNKARFVFDDIAINVDSYSLEIVYKNKNFSVGQYNQGQRDSAELADIELWKLDSKKGYILLTTDFEWSRPEVVGDDFGSYENTYYRVYLITEQTKASLKSPQVIKLGSIKILIIINITF